MCFLNLGVALNRFLLSWQITIIPKPECFGHFGGQIPLLSLPFGVTSAEVAINCLVLWFRILDTLLVPFK